MVEMSSLKKLKQNKRRYPLIVLFFFFMDVLELFSDICCGGVDMVIVTRWNQACRPLNHFWFLDSCCWLLFGIGV
jgi:hypothetical protein